MRIEGVDPERAYKPAEIKKLKEDSERSEIRPARHPEDSRARARRPIRSAACLRPPSMAGPAVVEYEPDTELRDTEQIPLQEQGGIEAFLRREVLPYAGDAWYQADSVKT